MKLIKKLFFFILLILTSLSLTSCDLQNIFNTKTEENNNNNNNEEDDNDDDDDKNKDDEEEDDDEHQHNNLENILYDEFQVHFLELGNAYSGDSVYIKAGDLDILIDAGSRQGSATTITNYIDQFCTDGKLEYVITTHADQDHIAGFVGNTGGTNYKGEAVDKTGIFYYYEVDTIIDFALTNKTTAIYNNYVIARNYAVTNGATHYNAAQCWNETDGASRVYQITDEISFEILYNYYYFNTISDENEYSVCTMFNYNERRFMFTGDLEQKGEAAMAAYYTTNPGLGHVDLFKGGHHGSGTSTTDALLNLITPDVVCICTCAGATEYTANYQNMFPYQSVITRLAKHTDHVYVTSMYDETNKSNASMNGNIVISCNGIVVGITASNNVTKLKDTEWFNQTIYVDASGNYVSGKGKTDFFTIDTPGTTAVPRRVWPST